MLKYIFMTRIGVLTITLLVLIGIYLWPEKEVPFIPRPHIPMEAARLSPEAEAPKNASQQPPANEEPVDPVAEFCEQLRDSNDVRLNEIAALLRERLKPRLSPTALEMLNPDGAYFDMKAVPQSPTVKFISALRNAGFYNSSAKTALDFKLAQSRLDELIQQDPDNAAFPFFKLAAEKKGKLEASADPAVSLMMHATRFSSLYVTFLSELDTLSKDSEDPLIFLKAMVYLGRFDVPEFGQARQLLSSTFDQNLGLREHLGQILIRPALEARDSYLIFGYSIFEYSLGAAFLRDAAPSFRDFEFSKRGSDSRDFSFFQDERECDADVYRDWQSKIRSMRSL